MELVSPLRDQSDAKLERGISDNVSHAFLELFSFVIVEMPLIL